MRICRTKDMGYSVYECPNCHKTLTSYNTCKGRFCNSCGVKYAKQRTTNIMSKLVDTEHRHMVFTMSDSLWYLFQKDRNLLNIVFKENCFLQSLNNLSRLFPNNSITK